jgi:hypothetical protein
MSHDINPTDTETDPKETASSDDTLLAYMSGRNNYNKSGDIRNVRAAKRSSIKGPHKAIECDSAASSVQVGDATYCLNKGETITFQGQQYFAH